MFVQTQQTIDETLQEIQSWEHWDDIQYIAEKEYGMAEESFYKLLPEYQRFMALIVQGYTELGMWSSEVDKIWHAHILTTLRYEEFCMKMYGRMIHHIPNIHRTKGAALECEPGPSCANDCRPAPSPPEPGPSCQERLNGIVSGYASAARFRAAYSAAYGELPGSIWNMPEVEGIAFSC